MPAAAPHRVLAGRPRASPAVLLAGKRFYMIKDMVDEVQNNNGIQSDHLGCAPSGVRKPQ